jgi:hypothetical protein
VFFTNCNQKYEKPSFKPVWGRGFTEVSRTLANGLSFTEEGYQLEPEWRFTILNDTTISIFTPKTNAFEKAHIQFDHDSLFNIAWSWMQLKKLTKDSIILQAIKVDGREVLRDKSVVFMKFYANDYIKNKLHTHAQTLIRPGKADTLFIKKKVLSALGDSTKAFSARETAVLISRTNLVSIERYNQKPKSKFRKVNEDDYMLPEYFITIKKAYKKFSYSFSMLIDENGKLTFLKSRNFVMPEFEESNNRTMRAIVNGYLTTYLNVQAGKTLGMPHSSIVIIHVKSI